MARKTVGTILADISSTVNQDPTQPADGGADFLLWLQFINRAQVEWAESNDWEVLRKLYYPILPAASTSMTSLGLPLNFRKLAGPVVNYSSGMSGGEAWPEITTERLKLMNGTDKFFTVNGDPSSGYYLLWSPGTLVSGATVEIPYYSMPTSLVSATQFPVIPNSEFLTDRSIAYILEARSDPRYQQNEAKAREKLLMMIENAEIAKYEPYTNPIKILTPENKSGFRMGRN